MVSSPSRFAGTTMNATDTNPEKIMKLSIAELLSIPSLSAAASAFADVTGDDFLNPDFEPSQDVADHVAALIDRQYDEIAPIGQETPIGTVQASYKAVEAAKAAFRLMGLNLPSAWSDSQI